MIAKFKKNSLDLALFDKKFIVCSKSKPYQLFLVKLIEKSRRKHKKIVIEFLRNFGIFGKFSGLNQAQCSYFSSK